jgi:predicted DNA-binding helix-hairpin-helix protein
MELTDKLEILADAAKCDASCASSGAPGRLSEGKDGIGATGGMGICHGYTPDGRCGSLPKILLTNFCAYDCQYCVNRRTSNVPRARFWVDEVVRLTVDFYLRNYIDVLFLSSGIIRSADYTIEQLVYIARQLRAVHSFRGLRDAKRIVELRRLRRIRYADLARLRCGMKNIAPFIVTADYSPASGAASSEVLRRSLAEAPQQMNLWSELQAA